MLVIYTFCCIELRRGDREKDAVEVGEIKGRLSRGMKERGRNKETISKKKGSNVKVNQSKLELN